MVSTFLIKNGTVVDGTKSPPFKADVRVRGDRIVQVGEGLEREGRERVVDATGCYVTPGFIEGHNHFDGPMWWMPSLDPMPGYGVTTSVNGNCGFSAAPIHDDPAIQREMVDIFSFFEDIPAVPFIEKLPWDWRKWSEYRSSIERNVKLPVNFAAFAGHIAIRLAVMGFDAWERAATPDEIAKMCDLLDDALAAGSVGLSSNLLDHDAHNRPVPTWKADDAEWSALMGVIERHEGAILQVIVDTMTHMTAPESIERLAGLARGRKIRVQIANGVPGLEAVADRGPAALDAFQKLNDEGLDFWVGYNHRSITVVLNFNTSMIFAHTGNFAWGEVIEAQGDEAKFALLADPAWRERARANWDNVVENSPLKRVAELELLESESGAGPIGVTLQDYMDSTGVVNPSDALADWVLDNGAASILRLGAMPRNEAINLALLRGSKCIGNLSDAGAHGQMFSGVGSNIELLTDFVRDQQLITLEEAVHVLTGQPAEHFNLHDRGVIAVGKVADIVVFNLDEIQIQPEVKRWDVPDGEGGVTFRYGRAPAPMRLTMVNGVPTFEHGDFTGKFPGRVVGPELAQELPRELVASTSET